LISCHRNFAPKTARGQGAPDERIEALLEAFGLLDAAE